MKKYAIPLGISNFFTETAELVPLLTPDMYIKRTTSSHVSQDMAY